ncbi:MAG: nucleoside-diphosphate kinase [Candidatus Micrarchaeota archaeon]|nr:nucleoside-diphosphate kinase [Candidatus Micrarchaeota archaeon]
MERTLFIVKPDGVARKLVGEIVSRFEKRGFTLIQMKQFTFSKAQAQEFYSVHKERPFYGELVDFMSSGPVVAAIIEGTNAIATTRLMVGATKSFEAAPGTIRGDFALEISNNIIHASDSQESFDKESKVIFG